MSSQYTKPGIAAIALALLFPIYWSGIFIFGAQGEDAVSALYNDIQIFTSFDLLFVLIGALEIYIYVNLAKAVNEQLNASSVKVLLGIMIVTVALFHGIVVVDIYLNFAAPALTQSSIETVISGATIISIIALTMFTISALVLSIILLTMHQQITSMLKYFSVILLTVCILQITIFLAIVNIFLFPIALIVLAMYFFKDPETLEVI